MSGLFTRLARRALGVEDGGARLRVASAYETDTSASGEPEVDTTSAAPQGPRRTPAAAEGPVAIRAGQRAGGERGGDDASDTANTAASRASTTAATRATTATAATTATDASDRPRDAAAAAVTLPGTARAPQASAVLGRPPADGAALAGTRPAPLVDPTGPRRDRSAHERDDHAAGDRAGDGATPDADDDRPLLPAITRPRAAVERARSPRLPPAAAPADAVARPIVKVTVGRIDVRTTPPTAGPSRPAPARHQPLALDEYLRRRDRGGEPR